ncbi:MAG: hypothetical protein [Microvirus sp.]|nr:MAG: hypothetical protein [Microvirus sp.]
MYRQSVNKKTSAKRFKKQQRTTKAANMAPPPMRGGIRL